MRVSCDPPFEERFRELSAVSPSTIHNNQCLHTIAECELPLIDLRGLRSGQEEARLACIGEIAKASSDWGFFQVLNHGISQELLGEMRSQQRELFRMPFEKKVTNGAYRWGTATATSLDQFSWSEAFLRTVVESLARRGG